MQHITRHVNQWLAAKQLLQGQEDCLPVKVCLVVNALLWGSEGLRLRAGCNTCWQTGFSIHH